MTTTYCSLLGIDSTNHFLLKLKIPLGLLWKQYFKFQIYFFLNNFFLQQYPYFLNLNEVSWLREMFEAFGKPYNNILFFICFVYIRSWVLLKREYRIHKFDALSNKWFRVISIYFLAIKIKIMAKINNSHYSLVMINSPFTSSTISHRLPNLKTATTVCITWNQIWRLQNCILFRLN